MLAEIIIGAVFMVIELFIIERWIRKHEEFQNKAAWLPFRKMMLDAIVKHADELLLIATEFETEMDALLKTVRGRGQMVPADQTAILGRIETAAAAVERSRLAFFNIVQTVAPALQPYAAGYCNEVLWFGDVVRKTLAKTAGYVSGITPDMISDNTKVSHPLNGVSASLISIKMFRDFRFTAFKGKFTQSVWKKEALHYHEPDGEFLTPEDYAAALDAEKSVVELARIPRTSPVRSFFATD